MTSLGLLQEGVRSAAEGRLRLWGDLSLGDPWFLALLPVVLLAVLYGRTRRGREPGRLPALPPEDARPSLRQLFSWLPAFLQALALVLVVLGLARPLRGSIQVTNESEGVDIALVIDRSSSMQYRDLDPAKSRLDVVKEVVAEFAERRMTDREGASDYVGLISFARYPKLVCPFTLDVDAIQGFLEDVELVKHESQDGTAIGVALTKAVSVLRDSDAQSKVVVLLTDGLETLGTILPLAAAELAAEENVRVFTVFAGRYHYSRTGPTDVELDTRELELIAEKTGGAFFRAKDREALEAAYIEIEEMVRTPRTEESYAEHYDLYPNLLLAALATYALAWLLGTTVLRRLP